MLLKWQHIVIHKTTRSSNVAVPILLFFPPFLSNAL